MIINISLSLIIGIIVTGCQDNKSKYNGLFTGYIVAKEYTPEHRSNESVKNISYAGIIVSGKTTVVTPSVYTVSEKYVWFIANKDNIYEKRVDKDIFNTRKCGDLVTVETTLE